MAGDIHTTMMEKNMPAANKKRSVQAPSKGQHRMPDGHMMRDSEMKKSRGRMKDMKQKTGGGSRAYK